MVNAFWLDRDLEQAVAWLVDAHVTSSVFEWAKDRTEPPWIDAYTVEADERPSGSAVE